MSEFFRFDDGLHKYEVRLRKEMDNYVIVIRKDGEDPENEVQVTAKMLGSGQFQFALKNIIYKCSVAKDGNVRFIHLDGEDYELTRIFGVEEDFEETIDEGNLTSPMPGRIVKILVKKGDHVHKGQDLIVIEAMKMENRITAPHDGIVKDIFYVKGDQIEANVALLELERGESETSNDIY
ncbi:MAG: acetyl-CoA carboxylase biotin carboxyl carrier protein subunit [Candidatus Thorarchaeota archaeon]